MNIICERVGVTRLSQIKVGCVYLLRGTEGGFEIPPQAVRVEGGVEYRSLADVGHLPVTLWSDMGLYGKVCFRTLLGLDEVNIPEHGDHDRHLHRVPDGVARMFGLLREDNWKQDYGERQEGLRGT